MAWLLTRLVAERRWWTTLALYFPQAVYLAPLALTLPPALWTRDARALRVNLAAVLVVAGLMMGYNIPLPQAPPSPGRPRVRVLAYNIYGGLLGTEKVRKQIERYRPDVVVLSEVRGWGRDQELQRGLAQSLPGWSSVQGGDVRVASRWRFARNSAEPLGRMLEANDSVNRYKVHALVDAPFGRFSVLGVHFRTSVHGRTLRKEMDRVPDYMRHTTQVRLEQTRDLLAWAADVREPAIVAGDFNTPPAGAIYQRLTGRFRDSFVESGWGWGFTYPDRSPCLRIDYIFHTSEWQAVDFQVGDRRGSDHLPVFAELVLK